MRRGLEFAVDLFLAVDKDARGGVFCKCTHDNGPLVDFSHEMKVDFSGPCRRRSRRERSSELQEYLALYEVTTWALLWC